ncbi:MAG: sporulation protein YqfC [Clostridia bacterium]|nr:sporulation protein YqfC [Clostridia bacterium]
MKEKIIDALSIPKDLFLNIPKITLIGEHDLTCENCGGLLTCTESMIRFCTGLGILSVSGSALYIRELSEELAVIGGNISGISFE